GKKRQLLTPTTFSLIHSTDFADRYERQILPLLNAGYIVLADRYIFTAFARDAVRGCDRGWIRKLYSFARKPDLTFYFDVPLKTALARILDGRTRVKYHEAGMDMGYSKDPYQSFRIFQGKICSEYRRMVHEYDFTKIDATEAPDVEQAMRGNILGTRTLSLFYATDFADQLENLMIPALRSGFVVLADRYIYTLMARAIVRGVEPAWIRDVYSIALVPDAVFYLAVSPKILVERNLRKHAVLDY